MRTKMNRCTVPFLGLKKSRLFYLVRINIVFEMGLVVIVTLSSIHGLRIIAEELSFKDFLVSNATFTILITGKI